jgi:sulfide:quinone oxidoreductase
MPPLHVLIAGGGVAAVEAALALRKLGGDRVRLELMAPGADLVQRPESVRTPFSGVSAPRLRLHRLADLGVRVRQDMLAAVDAADRQVRTRDGAMLRYDRLIIATGAHAVDSVPGAMHFRGPLSVGRLEGQIAALARSGRPPLTFVVPPAASWPLPIYELALQSAAALARHGGDVGVRLVTPEPRPLDVFGRHVSDAVARLLDRAGVEVLTEIRAEAVLEDQLVTADGAFLAAGPVVTVPDLEGPRLPGLGYDHSGFLATDDHGRVHGAVDTFAAGDVTTAPIKQGGLAAQQADAAAATIAAEAGAPVEPAPATRVLRAELVTAERPLYLRAWPATDRTGQVSSSPLWDPPGKIAGRFLAAFIASGDPERELVDLRLPTASAAASATGC